jgi:hypothetical protein
MVTERHSVGKTPLQDRQTPYIAVPAPAAAFGDFAAMAKMQDAVRTARIRNFSHREGLGSFYGRV